MKEQLKYFLKIKAALIGTGGVIHLLIHSFAVKLLATHFLFAKAAILAFVGSLGPVVWAQQVIFPVDLSDRPVAQQIADSNKETAAEQIKKSNIAAKEDVAEQDGYPSYEAYQAQLATTEKKRKQQPDSGQTAVGRTSLAGAPMSEAEYYEYIAAIKKSEAEKEAERREHQTAVGKTTLAGVAE